MDEQKRRGVKEKREDIAVGFLFFSGLSWSFFGFGGGWLWGKDSSIVDSLYLYWLLALVVILLTTFGLISWARRSPKN